MAKQGRSNTFAWLVVIAATLVYPYDAEAIPAFSRTLSAPCALCHTGFPQLNAFGMDFKQRGYRMPGQDGKLLWEQPIPLSGKVDFSYQYGNDNWDPEDTGMGLVDRKTSALGLDGWQLFAGGTVAPKVSFFGVLEGEVPGLEPDAGLDPGTGMADTATTEVETETFLVQFNDLLPDRILNLRIGKDHVDNYFLSTPRRLTRADYLIQIQPMLGPSLMPASVGAEVNGFVPVGLRYAVGVRNYGSTYDSKDDNEQRLGAYYAWANQSVRGQTVSLMVSGDRAGDANTDTDDSTLAYGASLDLRVGAVTIIPGYFWYQEGAKIRAGSELDATSGTIEVIYPIRSGLLGTVRYDFNNWDLEGDSLDRDAQQYVASLAWYQQSHVRWVAEYSRLMTANLIPVSAPGGQMLMDTGAVASDLTRDRATVMVQVAF